MKCMESPVNQGGKWIDGWTDRQIDIESRTVKTLQARHSGIILHL